MYYSLHPGMVGQDPLILGDSQICLWTLLTDLHWPLLLQLGQLSSDSQVSHSRTDGGGAGASRSAPGVEIPHTQRSSTPSLCLIHLTKASHKGSPELKDMERNPTFFGVRSYSHMANCEQKGRWRINYIVTTTQKWVLWFHFISSWAENILKLVALLFRK